MYRLPQIMFVSVGVIIFVVQSVTAQTTRESSPESRTRMARIVTLLDKISECAERPDSCRSRESDKAFSRLLMLPRSEVVLPLVLERIQSGAFFQDGWVRNMAYAVLVTHRGETEPQVREQLLAGLTEARKGPRGILTMCAGALSRVDDEIVRRTAVRKLVSQWDFPEEGVIGYSPGVTAKLRRLASVIRGLGYFGKEAEIAINDIEAVFRNDALFFRYVSPDKDPNWTQREIEFDYQRKKRAGWGRALKAAALNSVFRIGGPERVLRLLDAVDPLGREMLLALFGWRSTEDKEIYDAFNGNSAHQQAIRKFAIESCDSPSVEVRAAALDSLLFVFGDDLVVFQSRNDYRLNSEIENAYQCMAAEDSDRGLRERAAAGLKQLRERLDVTAQKILREREKEMKRRQETPPTPGG